MKSRHEQKNIDTILEILEDEIKGRVQAALQKMHKGYKMTWVYQTKDGSVFPSQKVTKNKQLKDVYEIKGREYHINHILASDNIVMAEMIEIYPDKKTAKIYSTPMAMVWEFKNGKIVRGRHYCDPRISHLNIQKRTLIRKLYT